MQWNAPQRMFYYAGPPLRAKWILNDQTRKKLLWSKSRNVTSDLHLTTRIAYVGANTGEVSIKLELVQFYSYNSEVGMLDSNHRSPCKPTDSSHAIHSGSWATRLEVSGLISLMVSLWCSCSRAVTSADLSIGIGWIWLRIESRLFEKIDWACLQIW